ncbi:unnamed protein product, partial [marine sediment metagenome]
KYFFWINSTEDTQPAQNLQLNNSNIIQGIKGGLCLFTSDCVVTTVDEQAIYDNLNTSNKKYLSVGVKHGGMPENWEVKYLSKKILNKKELNWLDKLIYLKEE